MLRDICVGSPKRIHFADEIEDDGEVMLIWDFEITDLSLTASRCSVPTASFVHSGEIYNATGSFIILIQ